MKSKLSLIATAVAAIMSHGLAHAAYNSAPIMLLSGASATAVNSARALYSSCLNTAGNVANIYKYNDSTTSATYQSNLTQIWTIKCTNAAGAGANFVTLDATGNPVDSGYNEVRANLAGSYNALSESNSLPGPGTFTTSARLNPTLAAPGACTAVGVSGNGLDALSWLPLTNFFNCTGTVTVVAPAVRSDGGFMDQPASIFSARGLVTFGANLATDTPAASFSQVFGVGMSDKLYKLLQEYQTAKVGPTQLDASCTTTTIDGAGNVTHTATGLTTPKCQPSISRAQYASLINADLTTSIKARGVNFLIGGNGTLVSDLPSNVILASAPTTAVTPMLYYRRSATSGTTASTELYFLANPSASGILQGQEGQRPITAAAQVPTTITPTFQAADTTAVKNGLNAPAGVTISSAGINLGLNPTNPPANSFIHNGFAIGVLSGENNPLGTGGDSFRFAKINGVPMTEGLSNSSQTSTALTGEYDFFYRVYKMCPVSQSLACHPILDVIEKFTTSGQASQGVFLLNEGQASHGVGSTEIPTKPVISK